MKCFLRFPELREGTKTRLLDELSLDPDRLTERHLQNFLLEVARAKQIQNKFLRKLRNGFERAKSLPNGLSATCTWADVWTVISLDFKSFQMKFRREVRAACAVNEIWTLKLNSAADTSVYALMTTFMESPEAQPEMPENVVRNI